MEVGLMTRRSVAVFLLLLAAACGTSNPAPGRAPAVKASPSYGPDSSPQAVGVIPETTLHDGRRNKDLLLSIDYPIYGGPYPVIIFSHGYGGSNRAYEPLTSYWTANGYVVIRPAHADANAMREIFDSTSRAGALDAGMNRRGSGRRGSGTGAGAGRGADARPAGPPQPSIENIWDREREAQWRDRAADVSLVIDSLDELESRLPELRGKLDHARIGVGGHSYGAFTAMLLAGMKTYSNPQLALGDARVRAALAMSPQGVSANRGLTAESWRDVRIPMLYMTGSLDTGAAAGEDPEWRKTAFNNSPAGDKYFVLIEGARHLSFTGRFGNLDADMARARDERRDTMQTNRGLSDTSEARRFTFGGERNILGAIRSTTLAFWDATLKRDAKGREFLDSKLASDTVKVERK
jgi:predicted dienelactone hydrolase